MDALSRALVRTRTGSTWTQHDQPWVVKVKAGLVVIGAVLLVMTSQPRISGDGYVRFLAVPSLDRLGEIELSKYSLVQPFLSWPFLYFSQIAGLPAIDTIAYFNLVLAIGCGTILTVLVAKRYDWNVALTAALVLMGASMIPHHLQQYYGEVLSSFLLAVGLLLPRRWRWLSIVLIGLAAANTPILLVPLGLSSLVLLLAKRSLTLFGGTVVGACIIFGENFLKFGSLTGSPYADEPGFVYPVALGVLSVTLSFGKGIAFYMPALLLAFSADVRRALNLIRPEWWAVIVFVVSLIVVYSAWWAWWGGRFWGPRFFLILSFPASLLLALALCMSTRSRVFSLVVVGILWLSTWVGTAGFVYGERGLEACYDPNGVAESTCWFNPEYSALWRPFVTGMWRSLPSEPGSPFVLWQIVMASVLTSLYLIRAWPRSRQGGEISDLSRGHSTQ